GDEDPVGKVMRLDDAEDLKVTGVLRDVPDNSTFEFDFLLPFSLYEKSNWIRSERQNWGNYSWPAYVQLHDGTTREEVQANIRNLLTEKGQDDLKREFFLHPISRWRLYSNFKDGKEAGGMADYVN